MYLLENTLIFTILNGGVCIFGDYLVDVNQNLPILKAIVDNLTHAFVGFLSALIILLETSHRTIGNERILLLATSFLVSSFIDLDHFMVARSFKLSKAVTINQRPFLHFTTIPILLMLIMFLIYHLLHSSRWNLWLCVIICAFLTHHARDATRRGFTFWPVGSTKPVPYSLYIVGIMAIPYLLIKWLHFTSNSNQRRFQSPEILIV